MSTELPSEAGQSPGREEMIEPKRAIDSAGESVDDPCLKLLELYFQSRGIQADASDTGSVSIGRFQILREIGTGGCGIVYCARDTQLDRIVALKIPHIHLLHQAGALERFEREGRAAAALEHPNLVPVLEVGSAGPIPYLVSAYVDGPNLGTWLETKPPLSRRVVAHLAAELADGIAYCHDRQILHRDIKPSNVLLAPAEWKLETLGVTPRLTDFGLAKFLEPDATKTAGDAVGTAMYMAPETALGTGEPVGPAADVYSLGAVLYELIAGKPPWSVKNAAELVERLRGPSPRPPSEVRGAATDDLDRICMRCLSKAPSERYPSIRHLREDLQAFIDRKPPVHLTAQGRSRFARALRWLGIGAVANCAVAILLGLSKETVDPRSMSSEFAESLAKSRDRLRALEAASDAISRGELNEATLVLRAASGSANGPAGLADGVEQFLRRQTEEATPLHTFLGGGGSVQSLAVSPDGQLLAAGDEHGMVHIWSLETRELIHSFKDRDGEIRGLGFSPTRPELAVTGMTGTVNLWRTDDWKQLASRTVGPSTRTCISWKVDGDLLVTGARDGAIDLLEWPNLRTVKDWREGDVVDAIQMSGSRFWYSCRDHSQISTRSTRDPTSRTDLLIGSTTLYGLAINPDRKYGLCELGFFALNGTERVYPSLRRTVRAAAISGDGKWGVAVGKDGFIDLFECNDPLDRFACASIRGHSESVAAVAFCPDNQHFLTASNDGTVRLWSVEKLSERTETQTHALVHTVRDICLDSNGRFAVIADYGIMHGDDRLDRTVLELKEHGNRRVLSAGFKDDGKTLLTHCILPKPGIEVLPLDHTEQSTFVEIPDLALASFSQGRGVALVLSGTPSVIECRDTSDLTKAIARFEAFGPVSAIAYDHAAKMVVMTYRAGGQWHCQLCELTGNAVFGDWVLGPERPQTVFYSERPARCFIVCGDAIGYDIDLASATSPKPQMLCEGRWKVTGAACTPDGRTLAIIAKNSRDNESECFLWDRQTGCRFLTMTMPDAQAGAVEFINGGKQVLVGSNSFEKSGLASVRSWTLAPQPQRTPSASPSRR